MRIEIAERLRPFSHLPGTSFVVPGSSLRVDLFPVSIQVYDLSKALPVSLAQISMDIEGPVGDFTSLLDLEKGELRVWGKSVKGYFRYVIRSLEGRQGIALFVEKAPNESLHVSCKGLWTAQKTEAKPGETLVFSEEQTKEVSCVVKVAERLSLGSHKLQDWELVRRRLSFTEIFPIWYRLGQMIPQGHSDISTGTAWLLKECRAAIAANAPEKILATFHALFLAGFDGVLSPRLVDVDYQGFKCDGADLSDASHVQGSPLTLLSEGARLIRSLFVQETEQTVHVLPAIPPEFHCGRFLNASCGNEGVLTLEWTKKSIRCMTFSAKHDQKLAFTFSNHEKTCRLRNSYKDKGRMYIPGSQIDMVAGQNYWFDNFQR